VNWWAKQLQSGARPRTGGAENIKPVNNLSRDIRLPMKPSLESQPVRESSNSCPGCGSGNYMSPPGSQAQMRCFDCGYPQVQSGTGVGATTTDGTVKKATQVKGGGYSPTTIVGRVG
jgi:hypothetical protein